MLDHFKKLVADLMGAPVSVDAAVSTALAPLRGVSDELHAAAVAFVVDGTGPQVLAELEPSPGRPTNDLLGGPGHLGWFTVPDASWQVLASRGIVPKSLGGGHPPRSMQDRQERLYTNDGPTLAQWRRFGLVLAHAGSEINRTVTGVPRWLTALINDVVVTTLPGSRLTNARPRWDMARWAGLLEDDGVASEEIPATLVLALFQDSGDQMHGYSFPDELPGVGWLLFEHGHQVPASALSRLSAAGRVRLAGATLTDPRLAEPLAHLLAALSVDSSKQARQKAIQALAGVSPQRRLAELATVLATAPASRAGELIQYLSGVDGGGELLADATAANPKLGSVASRATERSEVLQAAPVEEAPLLVPPFIPFAEVSAAPAKAELREALNAIIAWHERSSVEFSEGQLRRARSVTDADLDQLVAIAEGRRGGKPSVLGEFSLSWIARVARSLTVVHLLRLDAASWPNHLHGVLHSRLDRDTDPRQVEEVLQRLGLPVEGVVNRVWWETEPEAAWPWAATHPEQVLRQLQEAPLPALLVLDHFPSLPQEFLAPVASIAVGDSKVLRPVAQRVLSRHPAARQLAEAALADSRGEQRAAAASWLASLAGPLAVPALRAALAKERREVPRASLLGALEASGEDISADLAPAVLLAEATKGLKAKRPVSMAWFDDAWLPPVRWADGTDVDPRIIQWWVVLADKMKDPSGVGLIDRYLSKLAPEDAAALGAVVLRAWVAQDTRHPDDAESRHWAALTGATLHNNAQHQSTYVGSAIADKGLLALTARMDGIDLANAVSAFLRNNPGRRSQAEALMHTLHANGQPAALQSMRGAASQQVASDPLAVLVADVRDIVIALAASGARPPTSPGASLARCALAAVRRPGSGHVAGGYRRTCRCADDRRRARRCRRLGREGSVGVHRPGSTR